MRRVIEIIDEKIVLEHLEHGGGLGSVRRLPDDEARRYIRPTSDTDGIDQINVDSFARRHILDY